LKQTSIAFPSLHLNELVPCIFLNGSVYFTAKMLGNRLAGAIVPPDEHLVSWHDAIQRKRSLCQEHAVLLVVQWLGVTAAMPMAGGSTLALPTFFSLFLCFFLGSA